MGAGTLSAPALQFRETALTTDFVSDFIAETVTILQQLDRTAIERMALVVRDTKDVGGRLFFCGSGGGAGHASHAACDFRKLAGIESYSVSDNVSELTARVNDEGWDGSYEAWLKVSRLGANDTLFVFSVGGGDAERGISTNLVRAIELARSVGARVIGIAGRDGVHLARTADACVVVPPIIGSNITAQTEGLQAVVWHLLVTHPSVCASTPKWESVTS
jgi:D-sedoheptulose 7-phosphate isomerase